MQLIVYGGPILVGFVLGYFFTTPIVAIITVIATIIAFVLRPKREQELGALMGYLVWVILVIGVVAMWVTHLCVTGTDFSISDFSQYIFRQQ